MGELEDSLCQSAWLMVECVRQSALELTHGTAWSTVKMGTAKDLLGLVEAYRDQYDEWSRVDRARKIEALGSILEQITRVSPSHSIPYPAHFHLHLDILTAQNGGRLILYSTALSHVSILTPLLQYQSTCRVAERQLLETNTEEERRKDAGQAAVQSCIGP